MACFREELPVSGTSHCSHPGSSLSNGLEIHCDYTTSLMPQRFNRIEPRRILGREIAEHQPDRRGEDQGEGDNPARIGRCASRNV
jgi:hypothetical protein